MNEQAGPMNSSAAGDEYTVGSRTDIGRKRERNEDYLVVRRTAHGLLAVVCDGMGGHAGGELASSTAAEAFALCVEQETGTPEALLRLAAESANRAVLAAADANPELHGMGTTLVAALVGDAGELTIANVGDSRAYGLIGGALKRLTADHSLVGEMVARGDITEDEAERHPRRNVITRSLGSANHTADIVHAALGSGDILLLATDGLHGMIHDAAIASVLRVAAPVTSVADELVARARHAGGRDNVTVVVIRSGPAMPEPATNETALAEQPRRGPRGLGLIIGVGLGTITFFVLMISLWHLVTEAVQERADEKSRNSGVYIQDSVVDRDTIIGLDSLRRVDSARWRDTLRMRGAGPDAHAGAAQDSAGDVLSGRPRDTIRGTAR